MENNTTGIEVHFSDRATSTPSGKLASAEVHFTAGAFAGLKLVGFAVWSQQSGGRNVTVPSRQYTVNGQRRTYALLRPLRDDGSQNRLRDLILTEYAAQEGARAPEDEFPDLPRP